ncbi:hypothetical protein EVAR_39368_1 [Eumeta japonica]|uniref:Uncharacterized protein n=1 Tax=Eumeta variegata TaxID=151549 RepID=A0A4C1WR92_EUMVA|nr:hypothetical protein EVAR_39368_1 [Eumeta japonica]
MWFMDGPAVGKELNGHVYGTSFYTVTISEESDFPVRPSRYFCDALRAVQRTKLCLSELPAKDVMRRLNTPRPYLLLPRASILCHCDALVTNFTETRLADSMGTDSRHRRDRAGARCGASSEPGPARPMHIAST